MKKTRRPSSSPSTMPIPIKTKKIRSSSSPSTMPILPDDIIMDILSRLPVKSLCRFRCVSKEFRLLTSNSQFVKMHFNRSKSAAINDETNQTLFVESARKFYYTNTIDDNNKDLTMLDIDIRLPYEVVGACNGLVCLSTDPLLFNNPFFLLNPSTRQHNELPKFEHRSDGLPFGGFGYDPINDDYKVIKGYSFYDCVDDGTNNKSKTAVYSTRTGSWKIIDEHVLGHIYIFPIGLYLNGFLHWDAETYHSNDDKFDYSLVSFDVCHEKFNTVPLPNESDGSASGMGILRGCICIGRNFEGEFVLWMMKDYGVRESWTKLIRFNYSINYNDFLDIDPICYAKNGQIVAVVEEMDSKYVGIWNSERNSFVEIISFPNINSRVVQVATYVESLVSP